MVRIITWRVGAGVILVTMIIGLTIILGMTPTRTSGAVEALSVPSTIPSKDRLALQSCQAMAQPDDHCRQIWADNRHHFLGLDRSSRLEPQP